jgi:hypothetical protein
MIFVDIPCNTSHILRRASSALPVSSRETPVISPASSATYP